MKRDPVVIFAALLFTTAVLILGYVMLGLLPMFLFAFGFFGVVVLWLLIPTDATFASIKTPFYLTLAFFVLHKLEERYLDFFPRFQRLRAYRFRKRIRFRSFCFTPSPDRGC